nr:hypothetical protein [Tanacetum cinerariifolium]
MITNDDDSDEIKTKIQGQRFCTRLIKIQVAQKKVKIAFENVDSNSRFDLIPSKIKYANKEVHFLGHVVNQSGLASYYRCFIVNFSKITKPLTLLTHKNQKYEWGEKEEEAFQTLKNNPCDAPILSLPDRIKDFVVYCDASNQGLGSVLMQRGKIELFSDYECEVRYHPGKANVVADALSRKERVKPRRVRAMAMTIQSGVKEMILAAQSEAFK